MESIVEINEQCCIQKKTIENLRNSINIKLVNNKNDYLKWASKPNHISQKQLQ